MGIFSVLGLFFGGAGKLVAVGVGLISVLVVLRADVRAPLKIRLEQCQEAHDAIGNRLKDVASSLRKVPKEPEARAALIDSTHERVKQLLADMRRGVGDLGRARTPGDAAPVRATRPAPSSSWDPFKAN